MSVWGLNWYKTRRHLAHPDAVPLSDGSVRAACSQWTWIWPQGHTSGSHIVPAGDSEEARLIPVCKVCAKREKALS